MTTPKDSTRVEYYDEFPFPLHSLPRPAYRVDPVDVVNVLDPVLRGVYGLLEALSEAAHGNNNTDLHYATCLLAGQVKLCLDVLDRWDTSRKEGRTPQAGASSPEGRAER